MNLGTTFRWPESDESWQKYTRTAVVLPLFSLSKRECLSLVIMQNCPTFVLWCDLYSSVLLYARLDVMPQV
ncbi:MAG: hypothetical protein AAF902_09200 [Chloroflexota bacterium]